MAAKESKIGPGNVAMIFGVTGLVGKELARKLVSSTTQWKNIYGVARRYESFPIQNPIYHFISCDLLNSQETEKKLYNAAGDVTHIFWVTWSGHFPLDSPECCEQNKVMMSNVLNVVLKYNIAKTLKHVSVQTGMKHYISLQGGMNEKYDDRVRVYDEECVRTEGGYNFYYVLEDLVKERLVGGDFKVAWSVIRPGLLMGSSDRSLYNVIGSLCVYGAICKHLNLPFVFGGTKECWEEDFIDGSDVGLVAEQHIWVSTNDKIWCKDGQAFNAINGYGFTWKEIWPAIGKKLGAEVPDEEMFSDDFWFVKSMSEKGKAWEEIVAKEGLAQTKMEDLANWEFMDVLFRCPMKMLGAREKADRLGFTTKCKILDSILYWIDSMKDEKLIP